MSVLIAGPKPGTAHLQSGLPQTWLRQIQRTKYVIWRITCSVPVSGVGLDDLDAILLENQVPNTTRNYGTGPADHILEKVSGQFYGYTFAWDCTSSNNDCEHNDDNPVVSCGEDCTETNPSAANRSDRYKGSVCLKLLTTAKEGTGTNTMSSGYGNGKNKMRGRGNCFMVE